MRVTFVLPMFLASPAGGFKVVYEYANRLQRRGHTVTLIHPRNVAPAPGRSLVETAKRQLWGPRLRWRHRPLIDWFRLDPGIAVRLAPDLRERYIPDGEAIIATAFQTAGPVAGYTRRKGRGLYLIQSYEDWMGDAEAVRASWRLPLRKIVISRWLERLAGEIGSEIAGEPDDWNRTTRIPLGLDFSHFRITRPIGARRAARIGMLAHPLEIKGTSDGLAALEMIRRRRPEIEAVLFGTEPRDARLPDWIEYQRRPDPTALVELYNGCRIFLHPSRLEGWGLPAAEAMACGCALVAARNDGVNEFAIDGENALLAPIESPARLAVQVLRLLADDRRRQQLAEAGSRHIRRFDWERSVDEFEAVLREGQA